MKRDRDSILKSLRRKKDLVLFAIDDLSDGYDRKIRRRVTYGMATLKDRPNHLASTTVNDQNHLALSQYRFRRRGLLRRYAAKSPQSLPSLRADQSSDDVAPVSAE